MPFLPGFECDVFVSYATANNQQFAREQPGWVTSLRDVLKLQLDEGLGRRGAGEVWMDDKLRGNEPFDEALRGKVTKAATLLVVLSEAYLDSTWCRRELELFVESAGGARGAAGRVFLIHYEPVAAAHWPLGLQGLSTDKYRFFEQVRDSAIPLPLGYPIPDPVNPSHRPFYHRLRELREDLRDQLKAMSGAPPRTPLAGPAPASVPATQPSAPAGPVVFLAEVYGDTLYDQRQLVKSHLEQSGLRVLPAQFCSRTPAAHADEMDRDLTECALFVQMLGRFGSPRTPDLPGGYERLEHERAAAAGIPVFRWRSRDLSLDAVPDAHHRSLLDGPDVEAMDFEELKRTIVERVRVLMAKRPPAEIQGERFVLINAAAADVSVADAVTGQLAAWNVGFDVVDESVSLRDLAESNEYDALLVIYGNCPHAWVRQQLTKCREILLAKKTRAPACAVYIGPPAEKEPLRCRPPRVAVLDPREQSQLRVFIENLPTQGTPA